MEGEKQEKSRFQQIMDGEAEPQGSEKGWKNLEKRKSFDMLSAEELREISRKGAEAVNKLHGEKKTAKQSLEKLLTLKIDDNILAGADVPKDIAEKLKRDNPNATLYDLIQIVAIGRAVGGNVKAMEYVRDTHGDKPIERVEVTENITTEQDRELLQQINERLKRSEITVIQDNTDSGI